MNVRRTPDFLELPKQGIAHSVISKYIPALKPPRKTRVLLLGCGVKAHFPWKDTCRRYDNASSRLYDSLEEDRFELIRSEAPFEDADKMIDFLNNQKEIDGVILFHASFTSGEIGAMLGRWLLVHRIPLLSWSFPEERAERLSANSMCCQNFLLGILNTLGVKYTWFQHPVEQDLHPMIEQFLNSIRAISRFKSGKVLNLGGSRVPGFYDCELDEMKVMDRYGLRIDRTDIDVVFDRAKKFDHSVLKELRDVILEHPACGFNNVPDEQVFQTLRLTLGVMDLAVENNYAGCAVKSWPELFDVYGCASDGAVSLLNDWGLITTEEGDMNGLMSSLALGFISEGKAIPTMMDISIADRGTNRLGIWHCGSSPTRLKRQGTQFEARKHSILENDNPDTAVGLMLEFLLELGEVTMVRYQYPESGRMYGWQGNLRDCKAAFRGSYAEMEPKGELTVDTIMGTIFDNGLDHHWSLGYGNWLADLKMMNHYLGVKNIEHTNKGGMNGFSSC